MNTIEIISGVVLILTSIIIIAIVLMQDSKGNGLAGAIGGGEMMGDDNRPHTKDAILSSYTKYAAMVFFGVTILVSAISIYFK